MEPLDVSCNRILGSRKRKQMSLISPGFYEDFYQPNRQAINFYQRYMRFGGYQVTSFQSSATWKKIGIIPLPSSQGNDHQLNAIIGLEAVSVTGKDERRPGV